MAEIQKPDISLCWPGCRARGMVIHVGGIQNGATTLEKSLGVS
jgi:hypothetical protein